MRLIEKLMVVVAKFDVPQIGHAEGRSRDGLPKLAQRINATLRRIAGYNRRIDGANRDSGNPIGMQIRLGQRLINARLIGAERAATLQQQRDLFERDLPLWHGKPLVVPCVAQRQAYGACALGRKSSRRWIRLGPRRQPLSGERHSHFGGKFFANRCG